MSSSTLAPGHDESAGSHLTRPSRPTLGDPDGMPPKLRRRRAVTLLLLTLVLPGSAQMAAGHKRLGRLGLRVAAGFLLAAVALVVTYLVSRATVLGLFTRDWFLLGLIVVLLAGAVLWAVLFFDAWRLARPGLLTRDERRLVGALTAVLMLVTSGSLVFGARQVSAGRDFLGSVFGGNKAVAAAHGRYNVLLLGGDSGSDRTGTRPDSISVVSIDASSGRSVMFGFARDTENINFKPGSLMNRLMPQGWNCGDQCLLNALYQWGAEHKAQFPAGVNPGVEATREAVEAVSGLQIPYYVLIDLDGFKRLVNAVGGLEVDVLKRTPIGGETSPIVGWIEPGRQHLDGYHALWYARSRDGSTNYDRMARQRCVMTAMLQQLDPQTVIFKFQALAAASKEVINTNLPESQLGQFADLALKARSQKIKSVNFVPPLIKPWSYDPTVITSTVAATITASERSGEHPTAHAAAAHPTSKPAGGTGFSAGTASGSAGGTASGSGASSSATSGSAADGSAASESDLGSVCSTG